MLSRRRFLVGAGATVLLAACGGTSTSSGGTITKSTSAAEMTFSWWGNAARDQRTNAVIDAFQKKFTSFKVNGQPNPSFQNYWDKLNTQIAGGAAPDII